MKRPPQDEKVREKAFNATVGMEAIEERQTLSCCKRLKYLETFEKGHLALTEAIAALKVRAKRIVRE